MTGMVAPRRARVLFVAGLDPVPGGGSGGQLAEARTVYDSRLQEAVELVPLSSTMASIPPPGLVKRAGGAARRVLQFMWHLRRVDAVFVYAADGWSLYEKGLMCLLARFLGRGVVVRFGSGNLPEQVAGSAVAKWWLKRVLKAAHVVTTQGPIWSAYFCSLEPIDAKVVEIWNAVAFGPLPPPHPRPGHIIAFAGWMQREKGIFDGLEAFRAALASVPDATFKLAGSGRDIEAFQKLVRDVGLENRVETLGWLTRAQVRGLFESADVLLFPSHFEGLPNSVLEAMGAGLPVIATRVGSIPDVIADGRTGLLVDVGDVPAMTRALVELLSDPARRSDMATAARTVALKRFDVESVWPEYARAFARALGETGRNVKVELKMSAPAPTREEG